MRCRSLTIAVVLGGIAWAQPAYTDRFIEVNGLRLHYLDWGSPAGNDSKPPFIMLHGISRVAHQFDHLAPYFTAKYHVIALDMRGHGDSAWSPEGAYVVEDYVKDLEAFADKLSLRDLTLLGNSTGGRVVQVYAGLHPDRVSRLIVEDVGPERTNEISAAFSRQVEAEKDGWASEDELVTYLKRTNAKTPEPILLSYAHFATKPCADGRLVWKRDPNLAKGFVPTEALAIRHADQMPDDIHPRRRQPDRAAGDAGEAESHAAECPDCGYAWSGALSGSGSDGRLRADCAGLSGRALKRPAYL